MFNKAKKLLVVGEPLITAESVFDEASRLELIKQRHLLNILKTAKNAHDLLKECEDECRYLTGCFFSGSRLDKAVEHQQMIVDALEK